jgi:hypothetical protein
MRHEGKYREYAAYKQKVLAGCLTCGGKIFKKNLCRECWTKKTYPNPAADLNCLQCGLKGTVFKGLCFPCYEEVRLSPGGSLLARICKCGVELSGKRYICTLCSTKKRRALAKTGGFGLCACGGNVAVKGKCAKCYNNERNRKKKGVEKLEGVSNV